MIIVEEREGKVKYEGEGRERERRRGGGDDGKRKKGRRKPVVKMIGGERSS
jgi:hypothetical protein